MKLFILFLFCLLENVCIAQTTFKVYSRSDNTPLPYATIGNISRNIIYSTKGNGEATFYATKEDSILVSYVGFKTKYLQATGNIVQEIKLVRVENNLNNVTVSNCKIYDTYTDLNNDSMQDFFNGEKLSKFGGFALGFESLYGRGKFATLLKTSKENAEISTFTFWILKDFGNAPKRVWLNPMIINFYTVEDSSGNPGELIMQEPVFVFPKKIGKQILNLEKFHLKIPEEGIFISFQFVLDEKYKWQQHYSSFNGSGDTIITRYGGRLEGIANAEKKMKIVFYDYKKDEWFTPYLSRGQLRYEAILKYCKE